ncbi:MAG: M48 family metallopeptidase [Deltaproteobacteria bacterium]|nr:M48 family metallopeptidase [Candidatus Zymogenaceae bacterium]
MTQDTRPPLPDRIVRSRRKTLGLVVESDGTLTIRAPRWADDDIIARVITEKRAWIEKKQDEVRAIQRLNPPKTYQSGELFPYLGEECELQIVPGNKRLILNDGVFLLGRGRQDGAKSTFEAWYRKQAKSYIPSRVSRFADALGLSYRSVKINGAKKRWGSCSSTGNLNFTWRLMMAPVEMIDYVIVHELCHLTHPNHSRAFWELVGSVVPDYRRKRRWLREHTHRLNLDEGGCVS